MLDRIYTKSRSEVDSLRQKSIAKWVARVATLTQIVHAQKTDGKLNLTLRQRRAAIKTRDGTIWGTKKSFDRKIATSRSSAVNTSRLVLVAAGIVVNATLSVLFCVVRSIAQSVLLGQGKSQIPLSYRSSVVRMIKFSHPSKLRPASTTHFLLVSKSNDQNCPTN